MKTVQIVPHVTNKIQDCLYEAGKDADITIVPDCGMGPGMNVSVALMGIESMDTPKEVYVWDGGLPLSGKYANPETGVEF